VQSSQHVRDRSQVNSGDHVIVSRLAPRNNRGRRCPNNRYRTQVPHRLFPACPAPHVRARDDLRPCRTEAVGQLRRERHTFFCKLRFHFLRVKPRRKGPQKLFTIRNLSHRKSPLIETLQTSLTAGGTSVLELRDRKLLPSTPQPSRSHPLLLLSIGIKGSFAVAGFASDLSVICLSSTGQTQAVFQSWNSKECSDFA